MMINRIIALVIVLSIGYSAYAFEIVYPKTKESSVAANGSFFIGNAQKNETVKINGEKVKVFSNGAFAHKVELKDGENYFEIRSERLRGNYIRDYYITKLSPIQTDNPENGLIEMSEALYLVNQPATLRATPFDSGMNRISELSENTSVIVNGEMGNFYRVKLSTDRNGWILKNSLVKDEYGEEALYGYYKDEFTTDTAEEINHEVTFSRNLPYEIKTTATKIVLNVFNVSNRQDGVYTVSFTKPEFVTYSSRIDNGILNVTIKKNQGITSGNLRGLNIVIDAGHGGKENGAIGCLGTKEKDVNLKLSKLLKQELKSCGANVIMIRDKDDTVSLKERIEKAKSFETLLYISLHFNAIADGSDPLKIKGTSVYYYNKIAKDLAQAIQNGIVSTVCTEDNGIKAGSYAVIRPSEYIGVLVETAYMINPEDTMLYTNNCFLGNTAKGITQGIKRYMSNIGDTYTEITPIVKEKRHIINVNLFRFGRRR